VLERTLTRPWESAALTLTAESVSFSSPPTKATNTLRSSSLERWATMAPVLNPPGALPPIAVRFRSTTWMRAGVSVSTRTATGNYGGSFPTGFIPNP